MYEYIKGKIVSVESNYIVLDNIENIFNFEKLGTIPFFITDNSIIIYFTPDSLASDYYDILTIEIPISLIELNI